MTGQKRRGLESRSEFAARLQRMQEFDAQPFTGYGDSSLAQQAIEALADHDVVITTYKAFSTFYKHFVKVHWKRIVLDEMQEVRSSTTALARQCQTLSASTRWMVSGTPLYESIDDLNGELHFLQVIP